MKKFVVMVALALLAGNSVQASGPWTDSMQKILDRINNEKYFVTVAELYKYCDQVQNPDQGKCYGYLAAVMDSASLYSALYDLPSFRFCADNVSMADIRLYAKDVLEMNMTHSKWGPKYSAFAALYVQFKTKYACPEEPRK